MRPALTPNQIVAENLYRARILRGWTQEQAAEVLEPYLGVRWSKATFSAAERSVSRRDRIREFTADELVAFSRAFLLPIPWFFLPPGPDLVGRLPLVRLPDLAKSDQALVQGPYLDLVFGTEETAADLRRRLDEALESIPSKERSESQRKVARYSGMRATAIIRKTLGDLRTWQHNLRDLAALLEEVESQAVEGLEDEGSVRQDARTSPGKRKRG